MKIKDILNLDNDLENLNVINDFFNQALSITDYELLLLKYLQISNFNLTYELSLKEGSILLDKIIDEKAGNDRELIYYNLFLAALNLDKFNVATKYLNLRKELLPEMKRYLSLLDEYELKLKQNQDELPVLETLILETMPLNLKKEIKDKLYLSYIKNNKYLEAKNIINSLYEETYENIYKNELIRVEYYLKNYETVIEKGLVLIDEKSSDLKTVGYVISALIKNGHFNYAIKLETDYEYSFINSDDIELKIFVYNELIKLYELLNNNLSIEHYKDKLKEITPKIKNESNKEIVKEEIIKVKEIKTEKIVRSAKYLEHFSWIRDFLVYSKKIDETLIFREYLRTLFIYIEEKQQFNEIVLYYNKNNYDSNLFNYKNKRLYDKRIINESLTNTLINETLKQKKDFFQNTSSLIFNKDILTQKEINNEVKFIYTFYLDDNTAMAFYFNEEINDPAIYYELLSGITTIIKLKILDNLSKERLLIDSRSLSYIINNNIMPIRILTKTKSNYNELASKLFNIEENYHIELFLRELNLEDAKNLEKSIDRLFSYPNETKEIIYTFNNKTILEYIFGFKINNKTHLISFFIDITNGVKNELYLEEQAITDLETKLFNKNKLLDDFDSLILDKQTFLLIDLDNKHSEIYGTEKANKFFIEFARATNKHFLNNVYRYNFNQLIVVLPLNDIRTVNNNVNEYLTVIDHLKSNIIKDEKYKVTISSLRYPVVTTDKSISKIFKYLDVSLQVAKQSKKNHVDFTYNLYEQEVYEQEIIDYLNNAIDKKEMNLQFKQIINLSDNIVNNYESELFLESINVNPEYLYNLARKRNKLVEFEYFHLEYVVAFLKKLEEETNYLIKITIPISEETFLKLDFEDYIISILKRYDIGAKYIKILVNANLNSQKKLIKAHKLIKYGIELESTYIDNVINEDFKALHLKLTNMNKKWRLYYENINIILNHLSIDLVIRNVNKKEDREALKKMKIKLIEGELYSKVSANALIEQIKKKTND